jgi:hypothetical protein
MIHTYQALINKQGTVQLLEKIKLEETKRALLIIFDESYEESIYEKSLPYLLSESSLAKDWNRPEEDEAWHIYSSRIGNYTISLF